MCDLAKRLASIAKWRDIEGLRQLRANQRTEGIAKLQAAARMLTPDDFSTIKEMVQSLDQASKQTSAPQQLELKLKLRL
jgi:hypothetical protein